MDGEIVARLAAELIVPDGGSYFSGDAFRLFCGPIVYVFLKNGYPLYVGMSGEGIARPGGRRHRQAEAREACDEVTVWSCRGIAEARQLEAVLIDYLRPLFNQSGKGRTEAERIELYSLPNNGKHKTLNRLEKGSPVGVSIDRARCAQRRPSLKSSMLPQEQAGR